ncbi:hypothetical protein AAH037_03670 [Phocaeicola vulgatus]|jgi:hypothetical protein|uniref:hypothetical protein n=1 Tax=Phocaeicola vulgatus TaxID=821 RepID=UPI00106F65A9|nr:hypothetical protein E1J05_01630 [Phocaeicola dorei]TDA91165.1 hypothetical protein E1J02_03625 [Phocaeicola dorei]
MAVNIKIQRFRTNDIVDNGGKQFELGRSWCEDFLKIPNNAMNPVINLVFKPLSVEQEKLAGSRIELKLSNVTFRGDRKAYSNSDTGRSQIKDFFIDKLKLKWPNNSSDYFAIMYTGSKEYILYYIPRLLYNNFFNFFQSQNVNVIATPEEPSSQESKTKNLQQIYYGAPGTSKSHTIKEETKNAEVIRTTFHPDSDYSTFVGTYKPTTEMLPICDELGVPIKIDDKELHKEQIVYKFVEQAFLQAYINAWKLWKEGKPQYLIIEEINRGNCAQIFGDLFQLLDRNDNGYSDYPITADKDLEKQLLSEFKDIKLSDDEKNAIDSMYDEKGLADKVLIGKQLLLPNNLYIWATMNTSDQSLFPIDSAFKRRWDWKYMPISDAGEKWVIEIGEKHYDWWSFIEKINDKISSTTNSEDKQLGYFFCKANKDKIITAERFVGKVLFYLWNDVFKDYEFSDDIFNDEKDTDGKVCKLSFAKFYTPEGKDSKIVLEKVELFLKNLKIDPINESVASATSMSDDTVESADSKLVSDETKE